MNLLSVGLKENSKNELNFYPNPASEKLYVNNYSGNELKN
jgi:hypothetical protein